MSELNSPASTVISTAARPDLDWSQIRETILMLNLALAQMEMAMRDSGGSVEVLMNSFTEMYGNLMAMTEAAQTLPDTPEKDAVLGFGSQVSGQMQSAIVAFQFYDRLSQRLTHVSHSLEELSGIVNDPARLYNPFAWHTLQTHIRSKYTMEDEKVMFDAVVQTGDVRKALEDYIQRKQGENAESSSSSIELF